jgi:hypothetical protein
MERVGSARERMGSSDGSKGLENLAQASAWGPMFYVALGLKDRLERKPKIGSDL